MAAADALTKAAETQKAVAQACEAGKAQGLSPDQSKECGKNQDGVNSEAEKVAEKIAQASPEVANLLKDAAKPMKAVKNLMNTAASQPGEAVQRRSRKGLRQGSGCGGQAGGCGGQAARGGRSRQGQCQGESRPGAAHGSQRPSHQRQERDPGRGSDRGPRRGRPRRRGW